MAENYVLLETINLTQSAASVTFDNIPQTGYTDLKIVMSARGNGTSFPTQPWQNCSITLNGASNSAAKQLYATASGTGSDSQGSGIWITDPEATANTFSNNEIYLPNYLSSTAKSISVDNVTENNGSDGALVMWTAFYSSVTTAVTSIAITPVSGLFLANSTFSLYGIAATGTTPATAPKATGGNIVANDGTYWYHAFLNSGTFTPQTDLTADVVCVAGGGGNGRYAGGGGGGGGVITFIGQSLTATGYNCTVGAGGAASPSDGGNSSNGSNSVFGALTAAIGGGGGGGNSASPVAGQNGGSGGGGGGSAGTAGGSSTQTGTGATNFYGNAGRAGIAYTGAGGGGAGGMAPVPQTNTNNTGNGGIGITSSLFNSIGVATNTGELSSSNYYYAGGGYGFVGGSATVGRGGIGGGGGGPSKPDTQAGANGVANTGGGGGTSGTSTYYGSGGSGIVIIRYAMV